MKAILLTAPNSWELKEIEKPKPKNGQVLVKMAFTPINPSDLAFLTGNYGLKKPFPVVPGLEGSGIVVEAGSGFMAKRLLNKQVACTASNSGDGTWAEYMLTDATKCIPLSKNVSLEQGSMLFVNPLTALSFVKKARKAKSELIVLSAAGSALAQMVAYHARKANIKILGIVRKESQKESLNGFSKVLNSESDNFLEELKLYSKNFKNVIFFDAISGGSMPYQILNTLPDFTKMVIYGRLDQTPSDFIPQNLLFKEQSVEGYWLAKESQRKSLFETLIDVRAVQSMLKQGFETQINQKIKLEAINKGLESYSKNMSAGKVLLEF